MKTNCNNLPVCVIAPKPIYHTPEVPGVLKEAYGKKTEEQIKQPTLSLTPCQLRIKETYGFTFGDNKSKGVHVRVTGEYLSFYFDIPREYITGILIINIMIQVHDACCLLPNSFNINKHEIRQFIQAQIYYDYRLNKLIKPDDGRLDLEALHNSVVQALTHVDLFHPIKDMIKSFIVGFLNIHNTEFVLINGNS
jgi:hypothetical protein